MLRMKLFFFFFLAEGPGFLVVVYLAGTVEDVAAGRFRAGRAVGGGGEGGGWRGILGSRLSPDCTIRFIHFSKAVLAKFSSSSSSSTATPPPPGPSAPGSCLRRLVASRSARKRLGLLHGFGGVQTRIG